MSELGVESRRWWRGIRSLLLLAAASTPCIADDEPALLRGVEFDKALGKRISFKADDAELRDALGRLSRDMRVAILLDRRIDPRRAMGWTISGEPVQAALEKLMLPCGGTARRVGDMLFVGPVSSTGKLRTLVLMRGEELRDASRGAASRRISLSTRHTLSWADATEPQEILQKIREHWKLTLTGADMLPYDLWAAGTLNNVNAVEALSSILIQFDRTFEWGTEPGQANVVELPERVSIKRRYRLPQGPGDELLNSLEKAAPNAERSLNGNEVIVVGTIEDQEAVAEALGLRSTAAQGSSAVAWGQRRFTLKADKVRARDALAALADQGIDVQYDEAALKGAGVDLDRHLDINVKQASGETLLKAICEPIGARFDVDGLTVTIRPVKTP